MSITPSTSKGAGAYTVIGGDFLDREAKGRSGLSIVLLNRGGRAFRKDLFDELCKLGVQEVLSLESAPCPEDVESLTRRHERLRFLIFAEKSSTGARIDAAFREALSDYVFVLHGDMKINGATISSRVFTKIAEKGRLCTVPVFRDVNNEIIPTAMGPVMGRRGAFDVQPVQRSTGEGPTLFPWDYSGVYHKDKHQRIGGFDSVIFEPWWQKLEYGLRAWLWGEEIRIHPALRVAYLEEIPPEDTSTGAGYRRFFFRTLAVTRRNDAGLLTRSRWAAYRRFSGESMGATRETWRELRSWVNTNRYRYVRDARELTELWEWDTAE